MHALIIIYNGTRLVYKARMKLVLRIQLYEARTLGSARLVPQVAWYELLYEPRIRGLPRIRVVYEARILAVCDFLTCVLFGSLREYMGREH